LRGDRRTLWITVVAVGWILVPVALIAGALDYASAPIEQATECGPRESAGCLAHRQGVIAARNGDVVTVSYDDRRRTARVTLDESADLSVGARVNLERWDGDVVALYDPRHEQRYRTTNWPPRWPEYSVALFVVGLAIVGCHLVLYDDKRRRAKRSIATTTATTA
jgi:hypothetical protein